MLCDPVATAHLHHLAGLVAKYDGRAPRYTSYPTAVQFTPGVDAEVYARWLAELPADQPVSLYVHVPFCARLCWFCGCNTRAVNRREPIRDYVQLLAQELELLAKALPGRLPATALHLGGGTPNMLTVEDFKLLFAALERTFEMPGGIEIAAELDPATLTRDWVQMAARYGLNRASLGVQSLDARVQEAVNRDETFPEVAAAVRWLRNAGVRSVNIDLMYGLPHQTPRNVLATVDRIVGLEPDRISLFGYAHVPWMKAHQKLIDEQALPNAEARLDQAESAAARLESAGYVRIGLDHFARPGDALAEAARTGRVHRNFQGYTTDEAGVLLGVGASAIGRLPQGYVQNVTTEVGWRSAVQDDRLPTARGVALTAEDRFRAEIIERLMCHLAVDLRAVCARHGRDVADLAPSIECLAPFVGDRLVRLEADRLRVVGDGRLVIRSICAVFDAYFDPDGSRHSKAL